MPIKEFVSPIAIDLGAKNTGVYFAHYPKGISSLNDENFKKMGKVYQLEKDSYSLLMANRTAKRHQKRGYDRRQMAKRLLKLIWEKHFGLVWDKDVQKVLSFLLNRRGFTFLTEDYDSERLSQFPQCAYNLLPEELKEGLSINTKDKVVNLDSALREWAKDSQKIKEHYQSLTTKICLEELRHACELLDKKDKLSKVDKEIWENMKKKGVKGLEDLSGKYTYKNKNGETKELPFIYGNKVNISAYLKYNPKKIQEVKTSLSNFTDPTKKDRYNLNQTNISLEDLKLIWDFNPEDFKLDKVVEKGSFDLLDDLIDLSQTNGSSFEENPHKSKRSHKTKKEQEDDNKIFTEYLKTHLHHLAFAIYKTHNELESGGRHRNKYFEEVQGVLESKKHNHKYLEEFCNNLHSGKFAKLTSESLSQLIGHISNFELKPLRKYFNDKKHQTENYWDEAILAEKFENWFKTEWRVNFEKDKEKAPNKQGDYKKLKEKWKEHLNLSESLKSKPRAKRWEELRKEWAKNHKGKLINFWLNTDITPFYTIPPYQNNNNRRPPKCQSLIFNPEYLNAHYKDWEQWLEDLKPLTKDYLEDYEIQLKNLKSSSGKKSLITSQSEKINNYTYSYFNEKDSKNVNQKIHYRRSQQYLKARILQFIFDRVKNTDSLKLNEIYSRTKKYRQLQNKNHILTTNPNNNQKLGSSFPKPKDKENPENPTIIKEEIEKAIKKSKLPDHLKTKRDYKGSALFAKGTFLHLVCKYYKLRQKAKDGRIFIQPKYHYVKDQGYKNTGRFDDKNSLLTYCNYKPRQKRYQMSEDLASLLQIPSKKLQEYVNNFSKNTDQKDENLFDWLKGIKGLKINCDKATQEQKTRRGGLKLDIQNIYNFIKNKTKNHPLPENERERNKQVKKFLQQSQKENNNFLFVNKDKNKKIKTDLELYKLCEKSKELCLTITNNSLYSEFKQKQWKKDLGKNPASAVYFLSQINNIVFKERNGNAKTCPVCSVDNAQRMQNSSLKEGGIYKEGAKAQRLPAIPTRLIDGAVMKIAGIIGNAIAKEKWETIKPGLEKGLKICVPIITESNQFEFEPSREVLVKQQRIGRREGKVLKRGGDIKIFKQKTDRIKIANPKKICPYTGRIIHGEGHIDHILPRAGEKGVLNDEANLIWASEEGNQHKNDNKLSLKDLKPEYKKSVFNGKTDKEVEEWIIKTIGNGEEEFKFGKYYNFMNLSSDEQKAFRHALFLNHPLRDKVIQSIDNRNRTLVNGTQRYFAEVLANKLYKKILYHNQKNKNKPIQIKHLSFDYFGVSSNGDSNSVPFIRKYILENQLGNKKDKSGNFIYPEISQNKKPNNSEKDKDEKSQSTQTDYSHLIDAKVAFMIALSQHCKEGSLKVNAKINPYSDKLYPQIRVEEKDFESKLLKRRKSEKNFFTHKVLFDSEPGAFHFLKFIEIEGNGIKDYLVGFLDLKTLKRCLKHLKKEDWKGCVGISKNKKPKKSSNESEEYKYQYANFLDDKEIDELKKLYNQFGSKKNGWPKIVINKEKLGSHQWTVKLYQIDKQKVYEFLIENFNTKTNPKEWTEANCKIFEQLQKLWYFTKRKKVIGDNAQLDIPKIDKFKCKGLLNLHLKNAWNEFEKQIDKETDILPQVKQYFLSQNRNKKHKLSHQKTRKVFSLPTLSEGQGYMLIKRRTWNGKFIYQIQSEKAGDQGVGRYKKYRNKNGKIIDILTPYFRSKNIVMLKEIDDLKTNLKSPDSLTPIEKNKWYSLSVPEKLQSIVEKIENKHQSKNVSMYKVKFKKEAILENIIELMFSGYHIDEMTIGKKFTKKEKKGFDNLLEKEKKLIQNLSERGKIKVEIKEFFKGCNSIEEAKKMLEKITEKSNKEKNKTQKKQYKKWLDCLNSLQADKKTLIYKRGVGLKINSRV